MRTNQNNSLKSFFSLNRKLHIHLGLFILLFLWLYFISGLIIHHGEWKFAQFWEKRKETKSEFNLPVEKITNSPQIVEVIEQKLNITGEVENLKIKPNRIEFRITSPGLMHEIQLDPATGNGTLKVLKYNFWGKFRTLHLFNGMNKNDPSKTPNWYVTKLWRFTMDLTAIVLIILCIGSWIMWYKVRKEYRLGALFLGAGLLISGYFLFLVDLL